MLRAFPCFGGVAPRIERTSSFAHLWAAGNEHSDEEDARAQWTEVQILSRLASLGIVIISIIIIITILIRSYVCQCASFAVLVTLPLLSLVVATICGCCYCSSCCCWFLSPLLRLLVVAGAFLVNAFVRWLLVLTFFGQSESMLPST